MSRVTATERVQRILTVVPWIVANQGATVDEISERFGLQRSELVADLEFVFYNVGLHPFTPDVLAEVTIDDDRVRIHIGDYFRRPLRPTHAEALSLLTAGRALADRPGIDPDGTLRRAVDKLAAVLGEEDGAAIDVALGEADPAMLHTVSEATAERSRLRIRYYSYGRDDATERVVDPVRLVARDGHWYLLAHCHSASGERLFRVDRIDAAEPTGETFDAPDDAGSAEPDLSAVRRSVEVVAPAAARWVAETYPCDEFEELADDRVRIVLPVTADAWLERLLLRLGPDTEVRDQATGEDLSEVAASAASRILARYGVGPAHGGHAPQR